jgi:group I intron endonuclease
MTSGIYSITNTVNGKKYYGSSVNVWGRKRQHWSDLQNGRHKNPHLQSAWNKYGKVSFAFAVVEELPSEKLVDAEQRYLDGNEGGYNIGTFADAPARGRKKSPETIAKMSAARRGRPLSEAHKKALSLAGKGRKMTDAQRAEASKRMKGRAVEDGTKEKISAAVASLWEDENYRERIIAAQAAGKGTDEAKKNYSAAVTARWADSEQREKMSAERKARWEDPAYRAKMIEKRRIQGQKLRERNLAKKETEYARA